MKSVMISDKIKSSYIRKNLLFRHVDEEQFREISTKAKLVKLKRKDPFLLNNELVSRVFFLSNGTAKLVHFSGENRDSVKDILVDGDVFGDFSFNGTNINGYVTGLQPKTFMFYFPSKEFRRILQRNHTMSLNYMEIVSRKLRHQEARLSICMSKDARLRLLYFFQSWASCAGTRTGNSVIFENHFTLRDIAELIGVTRQFIHTMLRKLRNEGFLTYSRRQIEVSMTFLEQDVEKQKLTG